MFALLSTIFIKTIKTQLTNNIKTFWPYSKTEHWLELKFKFIGLLKATSSFWPSDLIFNMIKRDLTKMCNKVLQV